MDHNWLWSAGFSINTTNRKKISLSGSITTDDLIHFCVYIIIADSSPVSQRVNDINIISDGLFLAININFSNDQICLRKINVNILAIVHCALRDNFSLDIESSSHSRPDLEHNRNSND